MDLEEDIMLGEINQRKKNIVWYHLYMNLKKKIQLIDAENRLVVARGGVWVGKMGEESQNYKIPAMK